MIRIYFSLALFSLLMLFVALTAGLWIGDLYAQSPEAATLQWATAHRLIGLAAALVVVLVNSIAVTYFVGTSRWCKEVAETYHLEPNLVRRSTRLKRRAFPWAVVGMLTVVGVIALGGAADPGTGRPDTADWAPLHLIGAVTGILIIAWSYVACWNAIYTNQKLVEEIVGHVRRIRTERGLDVERPAAKELAETTNHTN